MCAAATAPADERERERGRVYGTPSYVSPEQASGNPDVDGRADVFGLGIVLFEALAGRVPFNASNVTALLRRIIREDAPRVGLVAPSVDRAMDSLIARTLAREPDDRFPTARALHRALAPDMSADQVEFLLERLVEDQVLREIKGMGETRFYVQAVRRIEIQQRAAIGLADEHFGGSLANAVRVLLLLVQSRQPESLPDLSVFVNSALKPTG